MSTYFPCVTFMPSFNHSVPKNSTWIFKTSKVKLVILIWIFTLPEILRERRVKMCLQSGSVTICEAMNTFGNVEMFAPPFSSLHPLLVFMCVFPRLFLLLSVTCFQNLERERPPLFKAIISGFMSWNVKGSTPFSHRCPPQPWRLACKNVGIAEKNLTILCWQGTCWNNFTASFSFYSRNWGNE